jgi:hypothetical protein
MTYLRIIFLTYFQCTNMMKHYLYPLVDVAKWHSDLIIIDHAHTCYLYRTISRLHFLFTSEVDVITFQWPLVTTDDTYNLFIHADTFELLLVVELSLDTLTDKIINT